MNLRQHRQVKCASLILGMAGVVVGLLMNAAMAGEPLRFSNAGKKLETPKQNPLEQYLNRPFESLKPESSLGPVISPAMLVPSARPDLPDKDERNRSGWQNSWIFDLPQNSGRTQTAEEMFKVKPMGPDGRPQPKTSLMEEYFKQRDKDRQPNRESTGNQGDWKDDYGRASTSPLASPMDKHDNADGQTHSPRSPLATNDRESWNNSTRLETQRSDLTLGDLFKNMRDDVKKERERDQRNQEFREMLDNRNFWSPAGDRKDSLGLSDAAAREQDSLPSAMREMGTFNRIPRRDPLAGQSDLQLNRSSLGTSTDPILRGPTLTTPSAIPQPMLDLSKQRERPAVLPIPKRQF